MKKNSVDQALIYSPLCQHCGERLATRPRRLCWPCYKTPGIRESYPARYRNQYATFELPKTLSGDDFDNAPTDFPPGSEDKIEVMRARAERSLPTCHPKDAGHLEKLSLPTKRSLMHKLNAWTRPTNCLENRMRETE